MGFPHFGQPFGRGGFSRPVGQGGGGGPVNTIAPAINPVAIVATQNSGASGTWSGSPTLTYQWQRNVASVWGDISGATSINYTPVTADFGYALRLLEIPNGVLANAVASNSTNLTYINVFTQSVGSELFTNGVAPILFTGNNPTGSTVIGEVGSDPEIIERGAAQGHAGGGTGAVNWFSSATNSAPNMKPNALTLAAGSRAIFGGTCSNRVSGSVVASDGTNGLVTTFSTPETRRTIGYIQTANNYQLAASTAPTDITLSGYSLKKVTQNAQLVMPANSITDFFFTLPASPLNDMRVIIEARIQDSANFLRVYLKRNAGNYDAIMEKVVNYAPTQLAAAAAVGTTINGLRFELNGSTLKMFTTINAGGLWTQRGSTATDAAFATATGLNTLYNEEFTPVSLVNTAA